jgi:hypothetical protein
VQSALIKMLEITGEVSNCRAISYNDQAELIKLSGVMKNDKTLITSMRAGGRTNFVDAFRELGKIFEDKEENASRPHYIFFMTDGEDTCNNELQIMEAKEHLQAKIETFGGEVVFNVLGFADHHNEKFLEDLALIGTSDGSYSFVSPMEGEKALGERLFTLIESTSSTIGKMINIELGSKNVCFLGEWFGKHDKKVILPAKMTEENGKTKITTRKFVQLPNAQEPYIVIQLHEKLSGNTKPKEAIILECEKTELETKADIDAHNLKKMRSAMNMLTCQMRETSAPNTNKELGAGYALIKSAFNGLKNHDTTRSDIKRYYDHVQELINQCEYVFNPTLGVSETERSKRSHNMMSEGSSRPSGQMQNLSCQRQSSNVNRPSHRSTMQMMVKQTDYSNCSDGEED